MGRLATPRRAYVDKQLPRSSASSFAIERLAGKAKLSQNRSAAGPRRRRRGSAAEGRVAGRPRWRRHGAGRAEPPS